MDNEDKLDLIKEYVYWLEHGSQHEQAKYLIDMFMDSIFGEWNKHKVSQLRDKNKIDVDDCDNNYNGKYTLEQFVKKFIY